MCSFLPLEREFRLRRIYPRPAPCKRACRSSGGVCEPMRLLCKRCAEGAGNLNPRLRQCSLKPIFLIAQTVPVCEIREFRLRRIFLLSPHVSKLPSACSQNANPCVCYANAVSIIDTASKQKSHTLWCGVFVFGDPYGNRTHVTAVKGPCLNRLTNGPAW